MESVFSRSPNRRRFVATLVGAAALPAAAEFRVEVSGVGATQLPIAIAAFRDEAQAPTQVSAVIAADLARSGQFRIVDAAKPLDAASALDAAEWRGAGVDALLAGSVSRAADGRWDVRYKILDVLKNEVVEGAQRAQPAADLRLAAHRIADDIYEKLTGEKGVFATRIAFVERAGRRATLHITDADGEGAQVALQSLEPIISPAWSPDGRSLAYVSFETQKPVVWLQELLTGARRPVANFRGSNSAPAWSPDGQQLAVTLTRDGISQLYVMPAAGGTPRRLTASSAIDTEALWSADGQTIWFVSDRGGSPQIYKVAVSGGAPQRVTFDSPYSISPALSPDGKTLAYITRQSGAFRLATLDLASGTTRLLTDTQDDESPSFAPNGRLLVYATRQGGRDVLMTTTLDGKIKTRLLSSGDVREPAWGPFSR